MVYLSKYTVSASKEHWKIAHDRFKVGAMKKTRAEKKKKEKKIDKKNSIFLK